MENKNNLDKSEKYGALIILLVISVMFIAAFVYGQMYEVKRETTTSTTTTTTVAATDYSREETTEAPAVPYIGMSESRIDSTALGTAKRRGHINNEMINGQVYPAYLYDFYRGNTLVFTARCVQGRVYNVWDYRNTTTTTQRHTTKRHTTKKYDEYDVYDYSNEEDFYYDHYDDFYDYYEAEDYYNEHHDD